MVIDIRSLNGLDQKNIADLVPSIDKAMFSPPESHSPGVPYLQSFQVSGRPDSADYQEEQGTSSKNQYLLKETHQGFTPYPYSTHAPENVGKGR